MSVFHLYGLLIGLGILAGYKLTQKRTGAYNLGEEDLGRILFWIVAGAVIGARIYHVIDLHQYYLIHPIEVFYIWNGGLAIYGAIIGGALGALLSKKNNLLSWLDALAPGVLLAQAIGRWGNFVNQEAYGPPTNLPWGVYIASQHQFFHPLFLYESLWNLLGTFLLLKKFTDPKIRGLSVGFYLIWYGTGRFFLEFLRSDTAVFNGVKVAQAFSLLAILIGACTIKFGYENSRN